VILLSELITLIGFIFNYKQALNRKPQYFTVWHEFYITQVYVPIIVNDLIDFDDGMLRLSRHIRASRIMNICFTVYMLSVFHTALVYPA